MENELQVPPGAEHALLRAADLAVSWWREHKPKGWGINQHLKNPTVNCVTHRERMLARAAARWYSIQRPSAGVSGG